MKENRTVEQWWINCCPKDTEEKRKKEKEDVAELLGKKKKKRDKKAKPAKLGSIGRIPSNLDKKPLPGIKVGWMEGRPYGRD